MSLTLTASALATAGAAQIRELPMSPYAYWAISFATFLLLLGVLWSFRNTAAKHETPIRVRHDENGGSVARGAAGGAHGPADAGAHH